MHCWLLRWANRGGDCAGPPGAGCFGSSLSKKLGAEGCRGAILPGGWGELHPGAGPLSHGAEQPREPQRACVPPAPLGVVVPRAPGKHAAGK